MCIYYSLLEVVVISTKNRMTIIYAVKFNNELPGHDIIFLIKFDL